MLLLCTTILAICYLVFTDVCIVCENNDDDDDDDDDEQFYFIVSGNIASSR